MTDKPQLILINVLLDQFFNIKVSQGSVATHLRCGGIFNNQIITQSLLSPRVKKVWKSVNICRSYGQLSTGLFFYETRCIFTNTNFKITCYIHCFFSAYCTILKNWRHAVKKVLEKVTKWWSITWLKLTNSGPPRRSTPQHILSCPRSKGFELMQ